MNIAPSKRSLWPHNWIGLFCLAALVLVGLALSPRLAASASQPIPAAPSSILSGVATLPPEKDIDLGFGPMFWSLSGGQLGFFYHSSWGINDVSFYYADVTSLSPCDSMWNTYGYIGPRNIWEFRGASEHSFSDPHAIMFGTKLSDCYTGILLFYHVNGYYGGIDPLEIDTNGNLVINWWYDDSGGSDFSSLQPPPSPTPIPPTATLPPSPTAIPTSSPTATHTVTSTSLPTATQTRTPESSPTAAPTDTPVPTATVPTPTPENTLTSAPLFTNMPCISPHTNLDVCTLERGDILLYIGESPWEIQVLRMAGGTYWFHAAVYVGDGWIAEANGQGIPAPNQVSTDSIYESHWWTGGITDWAVIRPIASQQVRGAAADYARAIADQTNPDILYQFPFDNKNDETRFYCSQLAWKAYERQGIDLETNQGIMTTYLVGEIVTPDDLYYSVFAGKATLTQQKTHNGEPLERRIYRIFSPGDLMLTDPTGRRVGYDPITGTSYNEIPDVIYSGPDAEPETIALAVPAGSLEMWKIQVSGTEDSTHPGQREFTLDIEVIDPAAGFANQSIVDEIVPGEVLTYQLNPTGSTVVLVEPLNPTPTPSASSSGGLPCASTWAIGLLAPLAVTCLFRAKKPIKHRER